MEKPEPVGGKLVLYTDGFTESSGLGGGEYGHHRLGKVLERHHGHSSRQVVDACVSDLASFRGGSHKVDDQTLMVLNFSPIQH